MNPRHSIMTMACAVALASLSASLLAGCSRRAPTTTTAVAVRQFTGGATSPEQLVKQYLDGLRSKDQTVLRSLAVNQAEYVSILLPGNVAPGQPLADMPLEKREYFWAANHTRSQYALQARLGEYGGRSLKLKAIKYPGPPDTRALYTALRNPLVQVENELGQSDELEIGSIVEVDGRYKFASFFWD